MADKFDIYIQVIPKAAYVGSAFFSFGPTRSLGVRGIHKLIGIFSKYLLTPIGTDPLDADMGTELPGVLGSNVTPADSKDILLMSVEKAAKAIDAFQSGLDLPDDERIATATVTRYIAIPEAPGFAAQIYLENVAGEGLEFLLPTLTART